LKGLEPISSLSQGRIKELAEKTFIETLEPDVTLFREGENDRQLVFLLDGQIELRSSYNDTPQIITGGMPESWNPLANQQPRRMSALSLGHVEIIRVDVEDFDRMMAWDQMAAADADTSSDHAQLNAAKGNTAAGKMQASSIFQNLPAANIKELLSRMALIDVKADDVVIKQGDPGDYYYVIDKGIAKVVRQMSPDADPVELAQLPEGTCFGEEALISDNPRNATVIMVTDGVLKRLAKKDFVELLKEPTLNWVELDEMFEKMSDQLDEQIEFLDVRVSAEFNQGHLPNAVNIPLYELRQREGELDPKTHYVCYCSTGRRSSAGSFILAQHGFNASVLREGIMNVPASFVLK
jgi:CRP-like cAMP-binding protein